MIDPMLKCRYTQARLTAFIHNELSVNARRYVARHIDECQTCRAQYEAQQTLKQDLMREMPRIGQPQATTLNRLWTQIEAEIAPQPNTTVAIQPNRTFKYKWAYVFAASTMVLFTALPFALMSGPVRAAVPQDQPPPQTQIVDKTHTPTTVFVPSTTIAQVAETAPVATDTPEILQNTPATPEAGR